MEPIKIRKYRIAILHKNLKIYKQNYPFKMRAEGKQKNVVVK